MNTAEKKQNYFIGVNGHQQGPYTADELQRFQREGKLDSTVLVFTEGMTAWTPLSQCPELVNAQANTPSPSMTILQSATSPAIPHLPQAGSPPALSVGVPALPPNGSIGQQVQNTIAGDTHYENAVFPKIEAGEKVFNWWAFVCAPYWFAYKGLWQIWAATMVPYAFLIAVLDYFDASRVFLGLNIGMAIAMGTLANKLYHLNHVSRRAAGKSLSKGNVWSGIGGTVAFVAVLAVVPAFTSAFIDGAKFANVPYKDDIAAIEVGELGTLESIIPMIAGATGKVTWKAKGNGTYVEISKEKTTSSLKFTVNPSTKYISLTDIVIGGRNCAASDLNDQVACLNAIAESK